MPTAANFRPTNATPQDIAKINDSLSYLNGSAAAVTILNQAAAKGVTISIIHDGNDRFDPNTNTIYWDPDKALVIKNNANQGAGVRSAAVALLHEAAHATDALLALHAQKLNVQYDNDAELYAVTKENIVAGQLGEASRFNHGGSLLTVTNSTEHTTLKVDGNYAWAGRDRDGYNIKTGEYLQGNIPAEAPELTTAWDFSQVLNSTAQDVANLNTALSYLENSEVARALLKGLLSKNIRLNIVHDGKDSYDVEHRTINWDPNAALTVKDNVTKKAVGVQSAALRLAHEIAHITDTDYAVHLTTLNAQYINEAERFAVDKENQIAAELGEKQRFNATSIGLPRETNSTQHTALAADGTYTWAALNADSIIFQGGVYKLGTSPVNVPVIPVAAPANRAAVQVDQLVAALAGFAPQGAVNGLHAANDAIHANLILAMVR